MDHLLDKETTIVLLSILPITGQQVQLLDTLLRHDTMHLHLLLIDQFKHTTTVAKLTTKELI